MYGSCIVSNFHKIPIHGKFLFTYRMGLFPNIISECKRRQRNTSTGNGGALLIRIFKSHWCCWFCTSVYWDAARFLAWYSANLASSSGRKCLIRPWTGQAAPSAKAQMVWPSICFVNSHKRSISSALALPSTGKELDKMSNNL